ncbi:DUF2891 domain-containing protein [Chamaesiphon minutus]|nr:DUF2891 domain-containing protein [Chamaesiphon minutus]
MQPNSSNMDVRFATSFVKLVLDCIDREYPHSQLCWFDSDEDIKPPREVTPAFYGCLDWHSAVHGHWLLVRLCRCFPSAAFADSARAALDCSLTPAKIQGEIAHLQKRPFFECPYGFAWLLQLAMELREWDDPQAKAWLVTLAPLETVVATNFQLWLQKLVSPDRTGTHSQTAFALGLVLDWARSRSDRNFADAIATKARQFYLHDCNYPLQIEPLAYDFISPGLAEADLMRRLLAPIDFANWLSNFLPQFHTAEASQCLQPLQVENPNDYYQAHFRGLNLSRAWMLAGISSHLPVDDPRLAPLHTIADLHRQHGSLDVTSNCYASSHWVGTFAVYLATARGLGC